MTRELLVTILRGNGYDVDVASDGIEALRWIADSTFDAIIMDLQLPHLDGGGVMTVVAERWPELLGRILILTGLTLEEMRHVFPVYATLSKPFTEIRLIHEVQGCIQAWDPELLRR